MREIAYTSFGGNALAAGLICHFAAILAGMMTASGADLFFKIVYPASWGLLIAGSYVELRHRGVRPLNAWRFYLIVMAVVFPLLGLLVVLGLIYSFPENGREGRGSLSGLFSAILKLRANVLMVFVSIILLLLLFAAMSSRHDPYFQKHRQSVNAEHSFSMKAARGEAA